MANTGLSGVNNERPAYLYSNHHMVIRVMDRAIAVILKRMMHIMHEHLLM